METSPQPTIIKFATPPHFTDETVRIKLRGGANRWSISITRTTIELILRSGYACASDMLTLWLFYVYTARWQKHNDAWAVRNFVRKGLNWGTRRLQVARAALLELALIEDVVERKGGKFVRCCVEVNCAELADKPAGDDEAWTITLTRVLLQRMLKAEFEAPGDLLALWTFYAYTARWQDSRNAKAVIAYVRKGLRWGKARVLAARAELKVMELITDKVVQNAAGHVTGWYVQVNYLTRRLHWKEGSKRSPKRSVVLTASGLGDHKCMVVDKLKCRTVNKEREIQTKTLPNSLPLAPDPSIPPRPSAFQTSFNSSTFPWNNETGPED